MAGAIAGTALVNFAPHISRELSTITLTVNNLCNLECPHCYLQYSGGDTKYIDSSVLDHLYNAEYRHLVIVGKEPFVNIQTVRLVEEIVATVKKKNRTVGIITNGFGLDKLTTKLAANLSYIDVSFDGGEITYEKYRKGNFHDLISKIIKVKSKYNFSAFNALHVVNNQTIGNLDDLLSIRMHFPFKSIMFSPYIETINDGKNHVEKLGIEQILNVFSNNQQFHNTPEAFILLDIYHLIGDLKEKGKYSEFEEAPNMNNIKKIISNLGLNDKVKLIEKDPIHHGFVRLTYDGYMLSPYASLNPTEYKAEGVKVEKMSLSDFFRIKSQATPQFA